PDKGVTMGLFCYPILMSADILMFNATHVPVGKDQLQHLEMTRDIAQRFNYLFGETFAMPEAVVEESSMVLKGLDGRKMSKSYNNTIPLCESETKLRKLIMKIKTNSLAPGEPKDAATCILFGIYSACAKLDELAEIRRRYENGIAWGEAKQQLFEYLNEMLKDKRDNYQRLISDPAEIDRILKKGAERARERATPTMARIRELVGIGPLGA